VPVLEAATGVELSVRPLSLDWSRAESADPAERVRLTFQLSEEAITSFFVLRIHVTHRGFTREGSTLINAELVGGPPDRHARLLSHLLADSDRFLRYLLLLLASEEDPFGRGTGDAGGVWRKWLGFGREGQPSLLEPLVRVSRSDPERIREIKRLVVDLGEERDRVVPAGFLAILEPVLAALGKAE